jgi:MSHA biogenesis protein MshP
MKRDAAVAQRQNTAARGCSGFALVPALFLIVVVGLLAAVAVRVTTAQQQTVSAALQQARALSAARAGIDWAAYNAAGTTTACAGGTLTFPGTSLAGFTVVVTCTTTGYTDGSGSYTSSTIASTATYGTYGTADYVKRYVVSTFTNET